MIQLVSSVACLLLLALTSWQAHAQAPLDSLKGDLSDRTRGREALRAALPTIKAPRGLLAFDANRQVITPIYVMRTEKRGTGS